MFAVKQITYDQELIFHGYLRINILSSLRTILEKLLSQDVIELCYKFYFINIQTMVENYLQDKGIESDDESKQSKEIESLWVLTDTFCEKKEFFIAYKICKILSEHEPDNGDYHAGIGTVLRDWIPNTDVPEAVDEFETAMKLDPTSEYHLYNYGYYLLRAQKFKESLDLWNKAMNELKCDDSYYNILAAYCHRMSGDHNSAYKCYTKTLKLNNDGRNNGLFADFLATDLHNYERAHFHYKKAIELAPNDARACWDYARLWRDCFRNYGIAEKYYLQSLKLDNGECGTSNAGYAYLLHLMGDNEKAKKFMSRQFTVDKSNQTSWTWIYHGIIFEETAEESSSKAVETINDKGLCKFDLRQLEHLKSNACNERDVAYFEQLDQMLRQKFNL